MIRTVVCEKEGCSGNSFSISMEEGKLNLWCRECKEKYTYDFPEEYLLMSSCTHCNNDAFKVFRNIKTSSVYCKCTECGNPPHMLYVDESGVQISYEQKKLEELKGILYRMNERLDSLENKADILSADQLIMQQSLGYISEFVQKSL